MAFSLPDLSGQTPIAQIPSGLPTPYFTDWLARVLHQIVDEDTRQDTLIAQLQSVQAQILSQQQQIIAALNAIAGSGGGTSGLAQGQFSSANTSTWTQGPVVSLTGVAAGHLTIFGSGPTQNSNTGVNAVSGIQGTFTGNWRIVEVIGGIDTVVYPPGGPGTYTAQRYRDDQGIENVLYTNDDTSTVSIARSTTGSMNYRLDFNSPNANITAALLVINVKRGA